MKGNAMEDKIENLTSDEVDVEALEKRLDLLAVETGLNYYCYGN